MLVKSLTFRDAMMNVWKKRVMEVVNEVFGRMSNLRDGVGVSRNMVIDELVDFRMTVKLSKNREKRWDELPSSKRS
jgi:hypothetical protein